MYAQVSVSEARRSGQTLKANQRAGEIEALHHLAEAAAFVAEPVLGWHLDPVEMHRTAADRA